MHLSMHLKSKLSQLHENRNRLLTKLSCDLNRDEHKKNNIETSRQKGMRNITFRDETQHKSAQHKKKRLLLLCFFFFVKPTVFGV